MFYIINIRSNHIFANSRLSIKDVFKKLKDNNFKEVKIVEKVRSLLQCCFCENLQQCTQSNIKCDKNAYYFSAKVISKIDTADNEEVEKLVEYMNFLIDHKKEKNYIVEV